jgi:hypothetical protein
MILLGWFLGLFVAANGLLLLFWPKHFLRFYDIWARGDYVGRTGRWRENVAGFEGKLLGLGFLMAGVYVLWSTARIFLK